MPSMSAFLSNEQFKHYYYNYLHQNIYIEHQKMIDSSKENENTHFISTDDTNDTNDGDGVCMIPLNELEERDVLYLISQNVTKSYIQSYIDSTLESMEHHLLTFSSKLSNIQHKKNIDKINIDKSNIESMYKSILCQLIKLKDEAFLLFDKSCIELSNLYHDAKYYPYYSKFDEFVKGIYDLIRMTRNFMISIESNQCNHITPYLQCILPQDLPSTAVRQICALLLIGISIILTILSIFIMVWLWYKNILINI